MSDNDRGFAVIPIWLLRRRDVHPSTKLLYVLLSSRVNEEGSCWPSQDLLADELNTDVRTVRRHLAALRDLGLVEVRVERTKTGRRNVYRLLVDRFGGADIRVRTREDTAPEPKGGEDMDVRMGEDTDVPRTTATGTTTTSPDSNPEGVPTEGQTHSTGALVPPVEAEVHPSRPMTGTWVPRGVFLRSLMREFPGVDIPLVGRRFVDFHVAKQDTSRSWEASLRVWVSQDYERMMENRKGGTDSLGIPYSQRPSAVQPAQPGDPDYVDPDEIIEAARQAAQARPRRRES